MVLHAALPGALPVGLLFLAHFQRCGQIGGGRGIRAHSVRLRSAVQGELRADDGRAVHADARDERGLEFGGPLTRRI